MQTLTSNVAELTTSDRDWRRDSDLKIGRLLEADVNIQRRLHEVMTTTDVRLTWQENQISELTTIVRSLQRQANNPASHFNAPDITMPAMVIGRPSYSANASYSVEEGQWLNMSGASPRPTLSASLGILPMPMASPMSSSSAIGGSPDLTTSPLLTLAAVGHASSTTNMPPMESTAAGQSQGALFLPGVDAPMSAPSDPDRPVRRVTGPKGKGKDSDKM
jgi:hypothetical protein